MSDSMCTCSVHCVEGPYHEIACCTYPAWCACWCHGDGQWNERPPNRKAALARWNAQQRVTT